ncbi:MAG: ADP-ribosylation factor-like protein [Patescibacteria group bacterium]|nr:ADP-ribosylation factor-like protein [Patescibacteria group bacterium]
MELQENKNQLELGNEFDFNDRSNMLQFKIVYWGPGESGKTTNFLQLREKFDLLRLSKGYSIETTEGRTLWEDSLYLLFDFVLKDIKFNIITHVVTCTGQERFLSTREYVLEGADGIVFVGDSDPEKLEQNKRSFRELVGFVSAKNIPYQVQLNKRDLEDAIEITKFKVSLGLPLLESYPDGTRVVYPTEALQGKNVVECFKHIVLQVIFEYFKD